MPAQILTDNGKVFTARFGIGPGPVMFDRICTGNGIKHLLTAPYSPTTTGKVERLHKTMRAEFFTPKDRAFATIAELQEALDAWVAEYNTARPHQSCGRRPPIERFPLADRSLTADTTAAAEPPPPAAAPVAGKRPAGVSRWVNAAGKISLAGFSYNVGATYAGEPVEVVVARAWWTSCTPGWWSRPTPRGSAPTRPAGCRGPGSPWRARDATAGPDGDPAGQQHRRHHLRRQDLRRRAALGHASIDVTIVAGSVQLSKDGKVIRVHPIRHDRAKELGAFANPKGRPRRKNSATGNVA